MSQGAWSVCLSASSLPLCLPPSCLCTQRGSCKPGDLAVPSKPSSNWRVRTSELDLLIFSAPGVGRWAGAPGGCDVIWGDLFAFLVPQFPTYKTGMLVPATWDHYGD